MKKIPQKELSELRAAYLKKREQLLVKKVDALALKLFEKVFNEYLTALDQEDGKLVNNGKNMSLVKGLDTIYKNFVLQLNIPVVKNFIKDLQGITPLNEKYFSNLVARDIRDSVIKVQSVVNKRIGFVDGKIKPGGFADKFIKDTTLLKKIKQTVTKGIVNKSGFQEFRQTLKTTIAGSPKQPGSGGLQQYYRNYAYDTFSRVDRLNQDLFAKDLGLRYFYWSGGVINTSRPLCVYCNGKIVDSEGKFKDLEFEDLKIKYQSGLNDDWVPLTDLGQFGCRHIKDYVLDAVAERNKGRWLDVNALLK